MCPCGMVEGMKAVDGSMMGMIGLMMGVGLAMGLACWQGHFTYSGGSFELSKNVVK